MSGFERALLEDKDRDELAQIAEMLGKKPPARSRKATIINLILELAGVTDAGPVASDEMAVQEAPAADESSADSDESATGGPSHDSNDEAAEADASRGSHGDPDPGATSGGGQPDGDAEDGSSTPVAVATGAADDDGGAGPARGGDGRRGGGAANRQPGGSGRADGRSGRPEPAPPGAARNGAEPAGSGDRPGGADQGRRSQSRPSDQGRSAEQGSRPDQGRGTEQGRRPDGTDPNQRPGGPGGQGGQGQDPNQRPGGQNQGQNPNPAQNPNQQQGGQNGSGGPDDDEGNRRRRRRGRNRDGQADLYEGDPIDVEGLLDLRDDGYGFLRLHGYLPSADDVYVSVKQVRQLGLRKGDMVSGKSRPASRNEKNPALLQIDAVNGGAPDAARDRRRFEDLTPLFPDSRLRLETEGAAANMTTRIVDLLAPVGKGQRGLIVSPPKAGKTTVMKQIARAIELNDPDVELIVLLVDERPEEVTDMRRWLIKGTVASSTFDRPSEEHIAVAELVIERAKRMVEAGRDVAIIVDGITRLARAYNLAQPPSGRIMSGGIDAGALYPPKRFFGAARNAEEGGSLTILATALVETGSKMDEHIFEEFKGTGNMELKLDRRLADRRIFPAIDIDASSTRHEELLFERKQVAQVTTLRKVLGALKDSDGSSDAAALELLIDRMGTFKTNADFLAEIAKAKAPT